MAAPVRLEAEIFTDPAVDALAALLGYADRDTAVGKLARLYAWQTEKYTDERPTYAVARAVLIGIFGVNGPVAMVEAGLATALPDGTFKIAGSDKPNGRTPGVTRVNWMWRGDRQRSEAGAESAKRRKAAGDPRGSSGTFAPLVGGQPTDDQRTTNEPPTDNQRPPNEPPSSPISDLLSPSGDLSLTAGARASGPPVVSAPPPVSADPSLRELLEHAIDRLNAARAAVDSAAPPLSPIQGQPGIDLLDHLRPLPPDRRLSTLNRAIDVMVDTLRTEGKPVDDIRLGMLAGARAWPKWCAGTVGGAAARQRGDPRRQSPADHRTGSAPPAAIHGTGVIDPRDIKPRPRP